MVLVLRGMFESDDLRDVRALHDLARLAHEPECEIPSARRGALVERRLLEADGSMNASVRDVVVSALTIDNDIVRMSHPVVVAENAEVK